MRPKITGTACGIGLLLSVFLLACGGSSNPHDGDQPCPDQPFADLNLRVGRLAGQLYRIDIGQLLLLKGATDRFETTVADHPSSFSKQEMFDLITAATTLQAATDSARSLLSEIRAAADSLDPGGSWREGLDAMDLSIIESSAYADSLFLLFRERARSISSDLDSDPTLGATIAVTCAAAQEAPRFDDLSSFMNGATDSEWAAVLPVFLSCADGAWRAGYNYFTLQSVASLAGRLAPVVGPVALALAGEVAGSEPGWDALEAWAGGEGTLRVEPNAPGSSETGLLLLFPEGPAPSGTYFQPCFVRDTTIVSSLPAGSYRLLAFLSGARPVAEGPFPIGPGETTSVSLTPALLEETDCVLQGGEVPVWVFDPSSVEHLANDYTLTCRSEVWEGTSVFQIGLETLPGYRVRAEATFRAIVDCGDRTLSGGGNGTVSIVAVSPGECAPGPCDPSTFTFRIEGVRTTDAIDLQTRIDEDAFLVSVTCPGDSARVDDITSKVFPNRRTVLPPGTSGHAETTFGTPDGPVYVFTEIDRVF